MICLKNLMLLVAFLYIFSSSEATVEDCAICSREATNAPCIYNTANGAMWEVQVYPPHPNISNAIKEKETGKDYGYIWLLGGSHGNSGLAEPDGNHAQLYIDSKYWAGYYPKLAGRYACQSCLAKLDSLDLQHNLVALDMYGAAEGRVEFFALVPGNEIEMRHYKLTVELAEYGKLEVVAKSSYYDGGKALDY